MIQEKKVKKNTEHQSNMDGLKAVREAYNLLMEDSEWKAWEENLRLISIAVCLTAEKKDRLQPQRIEKIALSKKETEWSSISLFTMNVTQLRLS